MFLLLAVLLCTTAHGQAKDQDVFAPVPAPLRARLVERLKLLIEYQRTQQWEKQYDLLSVLVTQGASKEDHVKRLLILGNLGSCAGQRGVQLHVLNLQRTG
jgi:hypothetical protein